MVTQSTVRMVCRTPYDKSFNGRIAAIYDRLFAFCIRLCKTREEAEDLMSSTILRAWRVDPENSDHPQLVKYDSSRTSFYGWCRKLAVHQWHDSQRHKKEQPLSLDHQHELQEGGFRSESLQTEDVADNIIAYETVVDFLVVMDYPERINNVFSCIYHRGMTAYETARYLRDGYDAVREIMRMIASDWRKYIERQQCESEATGNDALEQLRSALDTFGTS